MKSETISVYIMTESLITTSQGSSTAELLNTIISILMLSDSLSTLNQHIKQTKQAAISKARMLDKNYFIVQQLLNILY